MLYVGAAKDPTFYQGQNFLFVIKEKNKLGAVFIINTFLLSFNVMKGS